MRKRKKTTYLTVLAVLAAFLAGGCAGRPDAKKERSSVDIGVMLSEAGFQVHYADSMEKMQRLVEMPQRVVVPRVEDGNLFYVYADATYCQCAYVGDVASYGRFEELVRQADGVSRSQCIDERLRQDVKESWRREWGNLSSLCSPGSGGERY